MLKKIIYLLSLTFVLNSAMAQSKDSSGVVAAVESLRKAMIDPDKAALTKITSSQLSYGHSSGHVEDQASFVNVLVSGKSDFVTIDFTEQMIKVVGNTAIVRHNLAATTNDGGNPGTVKLHVLTVWQHDKGQWKMLARQAVKLAH